ncbi:MAG: J domain-containing protein [Rhodocyclaceae bacterium]|nr:J domain-containing protein [Rhodocyclaceae bacterium]
MMNEGTDAAGVVQSWLAHLDARAATPLCQAELPPRPAAALAALAAEALARGRSLTIVVADDEPLPDISNALDLGLRPLCLVLPAADYAVRIALRATLSLLKSRLARDDAEGPAWAAQRARLADDAELWQSALAWSQRGLDRESWPPGIAQLFPVHILPLAMAQVLSAPTDWVALVQPERLPADVRTAWPGALRTLLLGGGAIPAGRGALTVVDATARLRGELELLTQELAELELELATAQAEIGEFTRRYAGVVGHRMAELDRLQAQIAAARAEREPDNAEAHRCAERAQAQAEQTRREKARFADLGREEAPAFAPSRDIKKLYRYLAQKIHPDRARDERDRSWRTQLMTEANRAYRSGDESGLREILSLWQEGQGRTPAGQETGATSANLMAQVAGVRRRVAEIEAELNGLYGSRLYELFAAANMARRQGRDLLQEMADRLDLQIAAAQAELDGTLPDIPAANPRR